LKFLVIEAETASEKLQASITEANQMMERIEKRKEIVDNLIHSECQKLSKAVEARRNALLTINEEVTSCKVVALHNQEDSMTNLKQSITDLNSRIKNAMELYFPVELLSVRGAMTDGLKRLDTEFKLFSTDLCENDIVSTYFDTELLQANIDRFGIITAGYDLAKCTVSLGSFLLVKGVKKTVKVSVKDDKGNFYQKSSVKVVAHLSPVGDNKIMTYEGNDQEDGTYLIDITSQTIGEHSIDIKIQNQAIKSSPFPVYIRSQHSYSNMSVSHNQHVWLPAL